MSHKKALVIIMDSVEEVEAIAPIDILRRSDIEVVVAAAGSRKLVTGRNQIRIEADVLLTGLDRSEFDVIIVPGGPGHADLLENEPVLERLRSQHQGGGLLASICAGPVVLKKAGVLGGRRFTSFPATADKLPDRDPDAAVVVDGNLITSQAAGTAIPFALALVEALLGKEKSRDIARSICFEG